MYARVKKEGVLNEANLLAAYLSLQVAGWLTGMCLFIFHLHEAERTPPPMMFNG